jgi:hypothetical protein
VETLLKMLFNLERTSKAFHGNLPLNDYSMISTQSLLPMSLYQSKMDAATPSSPRLNESDAQA